MQLLYDKKPFVNIIKNFNIKYKLKTIIIYYYIFIFYYYYIIYLITYYNYNLSYIGTIMQYTRILKLYMHFFKKIELMMVLF